MALTQQQILQIKQSGKAKGYSDEQINSAIIEMTKQFEGGVQDATVVKPTTAGELPTGKTDIVPPGQSISTPRATPAPVSTPAQGSVAPAPAEGGLVSNFFKSLYNTGADYTKFVGEAAAQGVRAIIDPIGDTSNIDAQVTELGKKSRDLISLAKKTNNKDEKKRLLQESKDISAQIERLGDRARQVGEKRKTFLVDEEKIADRGQIVKTGAKVTAGAASLAIPGGATLKTAVALGATAGALYGFSEGEDIEIESILTGALGGAVGGGLVHGAGKVLTKGAETLGKAIPKATGKVKSVFGRSKTAIKESLEVTAEKSINKASPTVWRKGVEEKGLDINKLTKKYFQKAGATSKKGVGYNDLLGPIVKRGRGGSLQTEILLNEKAITKELASSSKITKLPIDDFIKSLNKELKTLKILPGNEGNMAALKLFIETTKKQYKNGMTPKTMLALKRAADSKYGKAVADEATGSATAQAQKMFANSGRATLKKFFPKIKGALDSESEIYTLRPILNHARSVLKTQGSGIRVGSLRGRSMSDLLNPLTYVESLMANPKIASKFLGGEAEQKAARTFLQGLPEIALPTGVESSLQIGGRLAGAIGAVGDDQVQPIEDDQTGQDGTATDDEGNDINGKVDHTTRIQQEQQKQQAAKPFGGRSKNELLQMAIAEGATLKDLKEIGDIYDLIAPQAGDTEDLLAKREKLADAGFSTTDIDAQLADLGLTKVEKGTQDIISQINEMSTAGERNKARASKDILDVVETAIETAEGGARTGPLSAVAAMASKLYEPNETAQLEKDLSEILRTIRKESTGVHFAPQEIKDLEREIPTIVQQEGNVKDSLARLKIRMLQKLENFGVDTSIEYGEQ